MIQGFNGCFISFKRPVRTRINVPITKDKPKPNHRSSNRGIEATKVVMMARLDHNKIVKSPDRVANRLKEKFPKDLFVTGIIFRPDKIKSEIVNI